MNAHKDRYEPLRYEMVENPGKWFEISTKNSRGVAQNAKRAYKKGKVWQGFEFKTHGTVVYGRWPEEE